MPLRNTAPDDAARSESVAGLRYANREQDGGARPVRKGRETWATAVAVDTTTTVLLSTGAMTGESERLAARE